MVLCQALFYKRRKSQFNQGILPEPHCLRIWFAKSSAGLRESALQRAWDSYTQISLLNPELPTKMIRKVGPGGQRLFRTVGRWKMEIAG